MALPRNLRFAAFAFLLWSLAYNLTAPLLPLYARELGASAAGIGTVGAATALGALLMLAPISRLADRVGRRTALLTGWLLSASGFLLMWLAHSLVALLPGAFLSSGAMASLPALNALALEELPDRERGRGFALVYAAAPLGALCGSGLAGVLAAGHGLRATTAAAGISVVMAMLALLPIREARPAVTPGLRHPPPGQTKARASLAGISLAVMAAGGFMLLAIPGSFIVPYLRDVAHQTLTATGLLTAILSGAQLIWSLLFSLWPRASRRVPVGHAPGGLSFPLASLQALALCLAANALFGLLLPLRSTAAILTALVLRGSQYTLQSLGSSLLGDVVPAGPGLTGRLTLFSAVIGLGATGAPLTGGWLYGLEPALPFWLTGLSTAGGTLILLLFLRAVARSGPVQSTSLLAVDHVALDQES